MYIVLFPKNHYKINCQENMVIQKVFLAFSRMLSGTIQNQEHPVFIAPHLSVQE